MCYVSKIGMYPGLIWICLTIKKYANYDRKMVNVGG